MQATEAQHLRSEISRVERDLREEARSNRNEARADYLLVLKMIFAVIWAVEILGFAVLIAAGRH